MTEINDPWTTRNELELSEATALDGTLVDLVLAVTECTEDEGEVLDRMDALLLSGRVRLEAIEHDVPEHEAPVASSSV